ncbi:hypothetical protein [Cetobacterium sp. SF1]|uniref:hypothetical protein n=1 Tax=Cetobacterium sp. SF1 TaxID=3417654 RepID=UPI003CE7C8EA
MSELLKVKVQVETKEIMTFDIENLPTALKAHVQKLLSMIKDFDKNDGEGKSIISFDEYCTAYAELENILFKNAKVKERNILDNSLREIKLL